MSKEQTLRSIAQVGIIAIFRGRGIEQLEPMAEALLAGGINALEVTLTTPRACEGIRTLSRRLGARVILGVGTVLDQATCREALDAGAQFVVSPAFVPEVVETTLNADKIVIPGALTPTEILRAWNGGADVVKVFPSTAFGQSYFRDVLAVFPSVKLTPTGGVTAANAGEWIQAGAAFVGAASSLINPAAVEKKDWPAITNSAKAFVDAIRSARPA